MLRVFAENYVYSRTVFKIMILLIFRAALSSKKNIPMLILHSLYVILPHCLSNFTVDLKNFHVKSLLAL